MSWSIEHIQKLADSGKIRGFKVIGAKAADNGRTKLPVKRKGKIPGIDFIRCVLESQKIDFVEEWQFAPPRKFRFDFAIVALKVGIEYEGLVATGKKGGHQTKQGYTSNTEKYNLATSLGWKMLRYTALNYKNFESDLKAMMK